MNQATIIGSGVQTLTALLLCGIMGLLGQGVRAVGGLKNAGSINAVAATQQSEFSAAYLLFSFMIGFIAGILAGLATGLEDFTAAITVEKLLGIAAAGYAGADFIENAMSIVMPKKEPSKAAGTAGKLSELKGGLRPLTATVVDYGVAAVSPGPSATLRNAIHAVTPGLDLGKWLPALMKGFAKYDLGTDRRKSAALGQFLVEAGAEFGETVEDLYYTHVEAIMNAFGGRFRDSDEAVGYLRNPAKLANKVYSSRLGNGDEASGDGYRYRGRGLIQLTGRDEYAEFAASIGLTVEATSDYCETPERAAMSGCWYLSSRKCLPLADDWDITALTRLVNGSKMLGLAQRTSYSNQVLQKLDGSA